jgi:4-hydroxy-4-methyl-2-oxoglutarate aldolase
VSDVHEELAALGSATVYEASGREGLIDLPLIQLIPGSTAAGPARTVACGQNDNLMVHAAFAHVRPGDVVVATMPIPEPVALVGDLLATQARARGVAALLIDAAVRDSEELRELGLPVWARWIRVRGAGKEKAGALDGPVEMGGAVIRGGDEIVLDADGAVVVARERIQDVLQASRERAEREVEKRARLQAGALSYDLDGLRDRVEGNAE